MISIILEFKKQTKNEEKRVKPRNRPLTVEGTLMVTRWEVGRGLGANRTLIMKGAK